MNKRFLSIVALTSIVTALGAGYLAGRARASGIPTTRTLRYEGVLTYPDGRPLASPQSIQISVWDSEDPSDAGDGVMPLCSVGPSDRELSSIGSFTVELPDTCTALVHAKSDLWAEVFVAGKSLGRSKLGAVPYAVEAERAVGATSAVAGSPLDQRTAALETGMANLQQMIAPKSAMHWHKTDGNVWNGTSKVTTMVTNVNYFMVFDDLAGRDFDVKAELSADGRLFTAAEAGHYIATCGIVVDPPGKTQLSLLVDGAWTAATDISSATSTVTDVLYLPQGGTVGCAVNVGETKGLRIAGSIDKARNFLSVARLYP